MRDEKTLWRGENESEEGGLLLILSRLEEKRRVQIYLFSEKIVRWHLWIQENIDHTSIRRRVRLRAGMCTGKKKMYVRGVMPNMRGAHGKLRASKGRERIWRSFVYIVLLLLFFSPASRTARPRRLCQRTTRTPPRTPAGRPVRDVQYPKRGSTIYNIGGTRALLQKYLLSTSRSLPFFSCGT